MFFLSFNVAIYFKSLFSKNIDIEIHMQFYIKIDDEKITFKNNEIFVQLSQSWFKLIRIILNCDVKINV